MRGVPEIDIGPLLAGASGTGGVARALDLACREVGVFYLVGHGVDPELRARLESLARQFFALAETEKADIAMARAGAAWRGWFPVGGELTSGAPDLKEGLYFGAELGKDHPRLRSGTPLHGQNLFPHRPAELREVVLSYIDEMTRVGQGVLTGIALGLGLEPDFFSSGLTSDPLVLFRIFCYPVAAPTADQWGVGEHTDYGLLTLLGQDANSGLQVRTPQGWVEAEPRAETFVCNLGDMLERLTGGMYRSTPHRVRNAAGVDRLSFPFFLDPSWDSTIDPLPIVERPNDADAAQRWDHTSVHGYAGTYGEYVLAKVGKVFPELRRQHS
ncbi:MAG: isopenicillin N synthase family dioxygenase [Acidimicrobiales bacterium]